MHTCAPHGCELVFVPTIPRLQLRYSDEFSPLLETELPDGCVHTNAIMYFVRVCALHACDFVLAVAVPGFGEFHETGSLWQGRIGPKHSAAQFSGVVSAKR